VSNHIHPPPSNVANCTKTDAMALFGAVTSLRYPDLCDNSRNIITEYIFWPSLFSGIPFLFNISIELFYLKTSFNIKLFQDKGSSNLFLNNGN